MLYILDLPKYLIDNPLDYVSYLSMLSHLQDLKSIFMHIGFLFPFIDHKI